MGCRREVGGGGGRGAWGKGPRTRCWGGKKALKQGGASETPGFSSEGSKKTGKASDNELGFGVLWP